MNFQLLVAMVKVELTDAVIQAGRQAGAPVATTLSAHACGIPGAITFFGMDMNAPSNVILFLLEERLVDSVMDAICKIGNMDRPCSGVSFVFPISNVRGLHLQEKYFEQFVKKMAEQEDNTKQAHSATNTTEPIYLIQQLCSQKSRLLNTPNQRKPARHRGKQRQPPVQRPKTKAYRHPPW